MAIAADGRALARLGPQALESPLLEITSKGHGVLFTSPAAEPACWRCTGASVIQQPRPGANIIFGAVIDLRWATREDPASPPASTPCAVRANAGATSAREQATSSIHHPYRLPPTRPSPSLSAPAQPRPESTCAAWRHLQLPAQDVRANPRVRRV